MGRVRVFVSIGFIGLSVLASAGVLPPRLSDRVESDAYYARVHIGLTHKGAPADIDFIVRCKDNVTRWRFGGSSHDPSPEKGPRVFVREIADKHAVGIDIGPATAEVNVCRGDTTSNGRVPKDWLPFIVWYDKADDLSFGVGYLTQDAYERPNAELAFNGANVEPSTKEAFEAHLAAGPRNIMPPWASGFITGHAPALPNDLAPLIAEPWRAWRNQTFGLCHGVVRTPLPVALRDTARTWRPANMPRFWRPRHNGETDELNQILQQNPKLKDDYYTAQGAWRRTKMFIPPGASSRPEPTVDERRSFLDPLYRPIVFPIRHGNYLRSLNPSQITSESIRGIEIELGDQDNNRGIVYCEKEPQLALYDAILNSAHVDPNNRPLQTYRCKVHKIAIYDSAGCFYGPDTLIEEGDYSLTAFEFYF